MEVSTTTQTCKSKSFILYSYFKTVCKNPVLQMLRLVWLSITFTANRKRQTVSSCV